jgi:cardiolipin synthase A/B
MDADGVARGLDRAAGTRPIPGNVLTHHPDSAQALERMLELIGAATRWIHFENYIIRDDRTGHRFADALRERARHGVRVRLLYDAWGSLGTSAAFWRGLVKEGVEVRAFNPPLSLRPFRVLRRDHRKLLAVDGDRAFTGGLCIGDEWAGDAATGREPWRDTMLGVQGPAAAALDGTFARIWRRAGTPLPADELDASPRECGPTAVRVVEGVPEGSRTWRAVQLLAATAAERLWITDAYLVAPAALYAALIDAARDGVDVRILLPGATDIPTVRALTRIGYRDLLAAGVRIFEWRGPMLHAKTLVVDRRWVRVGSTNLNFSSLLANYELDVVVEDEALAVELAERFRLDAADSHEIVLRDGRRLLLPRLVDAAALPAPHPPVRRARHERRRVAVVALAQVAGGLRRRLAASVTGGALLIGGLLLVFPRVTAVTLAVLAFGTALPFAWYSVVGRPRGRGADVP